MVQPELWEYMTYEDSYLRIPHRMIHTFMELSPSSQHFMEPGGSLRYPQEPTTGPYPEPDQSIQSRRTITSRNYLMIIF
jgi:hypothetical protein